MSPERAFRLDLLGGTHDAFLAPRPVPNAGSPASNSTGLGSLPPAELWRWRRSSIRSRGEARDAPDGPPGLGQQNPTRSHDARGHAEWHVPECARPAVERTVYRRRASATRCSVIADEKQQPARLREERPASRTARHFGRDSPTGALDAEPGPDGIYVICTASKFSGPTGSGVRCGR